MKRAVMLAVTGALLLQLQQGAASMGGPVPDALAFFKNYFITGDYVVGGIGLRGQGVNGIATGEIALTGVPEGADIVAAFLYWQVVLPKSAGSDAGSLPVTFNGRPLRSVDGPFGKTLGSGTAACWGDSAVKNDPGKTYSFRADVLRFFDIDERTGKFLINGSHQVQLPDGGAATALGASLVVIYRDSTRPLSAIVMYDGGYTMDANFPLMSQGIQGFYQAATTGATLTHIVGSGQAVKSEHLLFNGNPIGVNPFQGHAGASWDNPTFQVESPTSVTQVTTLAERPASGGPVDCLTWSAIVYRTAVMDSDGDGLLDIWESSPTPLADPSGQPLPLLSAMGADPNRKDVFVEAGYLRTGAETAYGGVLKPAHSHLPTHETLKLVGDAFRNAPDPIAVHFDMGNSYPLPDADRPSAEGYIVRGAHARGGEAIDEGSTVCERGATDPDWVCQFSDYPGTVGWKTGFRFLRDEVLSVTPPAGSDVPPPGEEFCEQPGYACERRFDRNRKDIFRYALFGHAIGLPKSEDPENPDFHVPRTNTGVGDFPGGDLMLTLGAFPDVAGLPVGTPFMQASTLLHELGHNSGRRHGGDAFEPNCKPTYLSVMNYLYQLRGLLDDAGRPHLDFSGALNPPVNETSLSDGFLGSLPYRIGWYAPLAGSYFDGFGRAATKHCDGSELVSTDVPMVRIDNRTAATPVDWNANALQDLSFVQDVNFNGRTTKLDGSPDVLAGSNDWAAILLNQTGARRNTGALYVADSTGRLAVGPLSLDTGRGDLGRGDLGRGDLGRGDLGRGDLGRGDLGRGDLGRGDLGRGDLGATPLGRGDLGRGDLGGGDLFVNDPNNPGGELDFETASDLAITPPNEFRACVIGVDCPAQEAPVNRVRLDWKAPNVGGVTSYIVYRVPGAALLPGQTWTSVAQISVETGQVEYSAIDDAQLTNQSPYTYFSVAIYGAGVQSDPSNLVTITAVNEAPTGLTIGDQVIDINTSAGPLAFTIVDEDPASVTLTGTSSNTALVPDSGIVFGGTGANRTVAVTPAPGQTGTATITILATDSGGQTATGVFMLTVNPVAVDYEFIGFKPPLAVAGSDTNPSDSGHFKRGRTIPVKWQLKANGAYVSDLESLLLLEAVPGTESNSSCAPSGAPAITLVGPVNGNSAGGRGYRYDRKGQQFIFNWDTGDADTSSCYRLRLTLSDGSDAKVTIVRFK